uniref:Ig-like domain-containing protein n=1 Tax=Calidris pygmaea TaxID=425635 RepID=A0A8C3JN10_9CHAR
MSKPSYFPPFISVFPCNSWTGRPGQKLNCEQVVFYSSAVAAGRAQVQQEPSAETTEGTDISISCSHPNKKNTDFIYWYRQFPGQSPSFLVSAHKDSKELRDPPGWLRVAADGRSSALWLARPRRGDAAVYYCALRDTGRGAGAAAGESWQEA